MSYLFILLGLIILAMGGEALVRGVVRLAQAAKISRFVIGFILLSLMTSAPELAVSVQAILDDKSTIALGNVIGSNIANLLLILALPALIFPTHKYDLRVMRNAAVMIVATVAFMVVLSSGEVTQLTGLVFLSFLAIYLLMVWYLDRSEPSLASGGAMQARSAQVRSNDPASEDTLHSKPGAKWDKWVITPLLVAAGVFGLIYGADILVSGVARLARELGISESVLGLSLVALGTSLPELATVVAAGIRKQADLVMGTIVGSNIVNILAVAGVTAIIKPIAVIPNFIAIDMWVLFAASLVIVPFVATDWVLGRIEAAVLVIGYLIYLTFRYSGDVLYLFSGMQFGHV